MAVTSQSPQVEYVGNGSQTLFTVPFDILAAGDLAVYVDGTLKTLTTHYTVDLNAGSMTFVTAPVDDAVILLERAMDYARDVDFQNQGSFFSSNANDDSDKHTLAEQQLQVRIDRTIRFAPGFDQGGELELSLTPVQRADKVVAFDADGDLTVSNHTLTELEDAIDISAASAAEAQGYASDASGYADVSSDHATAAANSAASAAAALDNFDDRYLGSKAVPPTLDNDGNALATGALYWDSVSGLMNSWDGASWISLQPGITQAAADIRYVNVNGDTMTGALVLPASDPTLADHATRKSYVDLVGSLPGFLHGLNLSTAGSSATFGVAAGRATNSTYANVMVLASAITKTTSAWALGTAAGALDAGTIANSTWYHVYLIKRPDTGVVDVLVSLSATAPTMPANYTLFRRIGSMQTNGSAQWVAFVQDGDWFYRLEASDYVPGGTSVATLRTLSIPTGVVVKPILFGTTASGVSAAAVFKVAPAGNATLLQTVAYLNTSDPSYAVYSGSGAIGPASNTSAQIYVAVPNYVGGMGLATSGWIDSRGKDS